MRPLEIEMVCAQDSSRPRCGSSAAKFKFQDGQARLAVVGSVRTGDPVDTGKATCEKLHC